MPGFNLTLNAAQDFFKEVQYSPNLLTGTISGAGYQVSRYTLKKFEADKLFFENEELLVVLEGVILNKKALEEELKLDWKEAFCKLYTLKGETVFSELRGTFSGCIYDKVNKKWMIFGDHIGSKPLYYATPGNSLVVSSEIPHIYKGFKSQGKGLDLRAESAYMLLSYGFMLDDSTLSKDIKKLLPGHYLLWENGQLSIKKYYSVPERKEGVQMNESEMVNELDKQFRAAVNRQFNKDNEYGYTHLVTLSGGLDSRMTSWVAHDLGFEKQLNITFSQSDYLDETVPKKIASDLKHEWLFKALDNGNFLEDIDVITAISGGNSLYYGLAHSNSMLKYMNFSNLGISHSGQLGDVVIGSFIKNVGDLYNIGGQGAYSGKLIKKTGYVADPGVFPNLELYLMFQRGFNGANSGLFLTQQYTETYSPFYDIDFLDFCFNLPLEPRIGHQLYFKWITEKYPDAANYIWERTKSRIRVKEPGIRVFGKPIAFNRLTYYKILKKLGVRKIGITTKNHMNPMDYWYNNNKGLRDFQDNYFTETITVLNNHKELQEDCRKLYETGDALEKNQVLSLLSAMKLFS